MNKKEKNSYVYLGGLMGFNLYIDIPFNTPRRNDIIKAIKFILKINININKNKNTTD